MNEELPSLYASCLQKQDNVKKIFLACKTPEEKYQKIIEMGKKLPPIAPEFKTSRNIVSGCQSTMYLRAYLNEKGLVFFEAESEALISAGLAAILLEVYNEEPPEAILKCPPSFIDEIGIRATLSPGRSSGLANIYLRMQQEALHLLHTKMTKS